MTSWPKNSGQETPWQGTVQQEANGLENNRWGTNRQETTQRETNWQETSRQEADWRKEERREKERQQRRRKRIEEMKREKRRREMLFRYGVPGASVAVVCILLLFIGIGRSARPKEDANSERGEVLLAEEILQAVIPAAGRITQKGPFSAEEVLQAVIPAAGEIIQKGLLSAEDIMYTGILSAWNVLGAEYALNGPEGGMVLPEAPNPVFEAHTTENTINGFSDSIISPYGIIIDVESGVVLAQKNGWERNNPASMKNRVTVLVAAEHITDFEDTFTMTIEITDYSYVNDCSNTGFEVGEVIPVKDLFYGTALKSGADAALGLAYYAAGSQEAFVEMMNAKLEELGLSETSHFTNCIGLYDEEHYSTPYDMAVILKEAADNEFCRQVLSEHHYVTTSTAEHPEGIGISNLFLRRIEDRDTHGQVLCAKTGYVVQSKHCSASLAADAGGREYICVTAGSDSVWTCIRDQVELYQRYLPGQAASIPEETR